ncbi:MAG: 50S ribosomal protein L3 [Armatimonadetes bacterium]|nr:50S ribosomal protein L3 [Armatimonadota bacterium]
MMKGLLGKKIGMTQIFGESGHACPVTVIEAGPCTVVAVKDLPDHGYRAAQLGFGKRNEKKLSKPDRGYFAKRKVAAARHLREFPLSESDTGTLSVGQELRADIFQVGEKVDVIGISKGKGFAGGMKRWGFSGGGASHGSMIHRQPASGGETNAARVVKGKRGPGRLGGSRVTVQGLSVVQVDGKKNLLLVRGAVPGANGNLVMVRTSVKK